MTEPEAQADLVRIVQRIMDGDYAEATEVYELLLLVARAATCTPGYVSDLIFCTRGPELTARQVVEQAYAYRPIAL